VPATRDCGRGLSGLDCTMAKHVDALVEALGELRGNKPRALLASGGSASGGSATNGTAPRYQSRTELEAQGELFHAWSPKEIRRRHELVCALHACGWRGKDIAEHVGYSQSRVSIIVNDPRSREIIDSYAGAFSSIATDVKEKLEFLSIEAVEEVAQVMRSAEKDETRLRAAFGVLDRGGYGKAMKVIRQDDGLTDDAIERLASGLIEAKEAGRAVIDVDYTVRESHDS
jgi:hypothetical protein